MDAIVILGCKVTRDVEGRLVGAMGRRVTAALRAFEAVRDAGETETLPLLFVTGGRRWSGVVEADAMRDELVRQGVSEAQIVRERGSFHTVDNARFTAELLSKHGASDVAIVTCDWHLPRARGIFRRFGVEARGIPAVGPAPRGLRRAYLWGRERVASVLSAAAIASRWFGVVSLVTLGTAPALLACGRSSSAPSAPADVSVPADTAGLPARADEVALGVAEDRRRAADVPEASLAHHDVAVRRRAARALARIADPASVPGLLRALSDEDAAVTAWAAYGLGQACKGHDEDALASALVARAVALDEAAVAARGPDALDPRMSLARALGRCAGGRAESTLTAWLRRRGAWAEPSAYGLGDLVGRRGSLGDESLTALLDAAVGGAAGAPVPAALYPLSRIKRVPDAFAERAVEAARAALAHPGPSRIFAVRALGRAARAGARASAELLRVVTDRGFDFAERAEAARGLGLLDAAGRQGAGDALAVLVPDRDPLALEAFAGGEFGVLQTLVGALRGEVPPSAEPAVFALARLTASREPPPMLARRHAELRCQAASALAKGAYDNDLLTRCDAPGTVAWERARLASIVRRPLTTDRLRAWIDLTKSAHVRVREAALEAIESHAELREPARNAIAAALESGKPGLVATAATIVHAHPERVSALSAEAKRAALDPAAPPPSGPAPRELDPKVAAALAKALRAPWAEDRIETKVALVEAAVTVGLEGARDAASAACKSPNVTLRQRAAKALATLGEGAAKACAPPDDAPVADEVARPRAAPVKLVLATDAGELALRLDPSLAPVTVTRVAALAASGFYDGIVVHRVVPGFVAQFGDPDGDGYGGSGRSLRCETSPVPFEPLTVGVALAGRDTGSSQLFVTLSRTPHLDGEYTRVGFAEGDWAAVAEGDVVQSVRVVEAP